MLSRNRIGLAVDLAMGVAAGTILCRAMVAPGAVQFLSELIYLAISAVIMAVTMDRLLPAIGWESVSVAVSIGAALALGPAAAVLLAPVPVLVCQARSGQRLCALLARVARAVVAVAAAVGAFAILRGQVGPVRLANLPAIIGAVVAYFSVSRMLVCLRDGLPRRDRRAWTRAQVCWATIHGGLIITWATVIHALTTIWADGLLALIVPAAFSASALALSSFYNSRQRAVEQLASSVGQRDPLYPGHAERVLQCSEAIARAVGMPDSELADLRLAATLCDIGQNSDLSGLAQQSRPLTEAERARLADHVLEGVAMVSRIPALSHVGSIIRAHHEWYNGLGYPDGLSGTRIPLAARIIAVADAFTAMTSFRPYRRMMTAAEALEVIESNAGGQFCPQAVAGLRSYLRKSAAGGPSPRPVDRSEVGLTVHALRDYVGRAAAEARDPSKPAERDWAFSGLGALNDLMAIMTSSLDIERVLAVAVQTISGLIGASCGIALFDGSGTVTRLHGTDFPEGLGQQMRECRLLDQAVAARSPISVPTEEIPYPGMRETFARQGIRRLIVVPLICRGRTVGGAYIRVTYDRVCSEAELNMLMVVASQAAMAVDNARLHSETAARLREISEVQAFNRWIIENTSTGVIAVNAEGIVTLISRPAVQILSRKGLNVPEGTGWSYPEWAQQLGLDSRLVQCLHDGQGCDLYSVPMVCPNGVAYFHIHITVTRDEQGRIVGLTDIFHDVTEPVLMEQRILETEKLSALAQLAGGAAHEIRNPLASVRGFVQLMQRRQGVDAGINEYMEIILSEIDRIDGIIGELLQLAKPAPPAMTEISLARLLDEVCLLTGTGATLHQVELIKVFSRSAPVLQGDANQLKQVFINVITNAIQATPYGGRIVVDAGGDGNEAWIKVSDSGEGIAPDRLKRIFEPFYTTKESGTGLGLTVCYSIVRAHGGRIDVESEPGKGTTFTIRLPLTAASAQATAI
ncbi:MAG: HD domain-containing phosphohydrolase [Chloroflexota bacterium]